MPGTPLKTGVTWYRTAFRLDLAKSQDTSIALRFAGTPPSGYRLMLFLKGWNLGQYSAVIGPQTDFVLPAGLLRQDGDNTLALAAVATEPSQLGRVSLVVAGNQRGGIRVADVPSPGFSSVVRGR